MCTARVKEYGLRSFPTCSHPLHELGAPGEIDTCAVGGAEIRGARVQPQLVRIGRCWRYRCRGMGLFMARRAASHVPQSKANKLGEATARARGNQTPLGL